MNDKQKYGIFVVIVIMLFLIGLANPLGEVEERYIRTTVYSWFNSTVEIIQNAVLVLLAGMSWVLLFRENKGNDNG